MSEEANGKELVGIGGWLVLFQIYIIMAVAAGLESTLLMILTDTNTVLPFFEPYYMALTAAMFGLSLACMILFYCKRMAFRPVFVVYGIVGMVSGVTYTFFKIPFDYAGTGRYGVLFVISILSTVFMAMGVGTIIAIIIALYKSRRVKNTFIKK